MQLVQSQVQMDGNEMSSNVDLLYNHLPVADFLKLDSIIWKFTMLCCFP